MSIVAKNISRYLGIDIFCVSGAPYSELKEKIKWKRTCFFDLFAGVFCVTLRSESENFQEEIEKVGCMANRDSISSGGMLFDVSIDISWNKNFTVEECSTEHDVGIFIVIPKDEDYIKKENLVITENQLSSMSWEMVILPTKLVCIVHIDDFQEFAEDMVDWGIGDKIRQKRGWEL